MPGIYFFNQGSPFKLRNSRKTKSWIKDVIARERKDLSTLNYIFCSDEQLLEINQQYLKHHTFTDVITFDNSDGGLSIEGDIFISVDRVKDNAEKLDIEFTEELHRVMVHGVLHLLGYSDKSPRAKALMRRKEDTYLSLRAIT